MSNPVDDFLEERTKVANPLAGIGRGMKKGFTSEGLGMLGAHTALTAGVLGGADAVQKIYTAITKKRDFERMMEANPDLKEYQRENPSQFNQHYNSLRGMNPRFGSEPIVAGTYMRQMSAQPASAGKVVVESLGGVPASSMPRDMMQGMQIAQRSMGPSEKEMADTELARLRSKELEEKIPQQRAKAEYDESTRPFDYAQKMRKHMQTPGKEQAGPKGRSGRATGTTGWGSPTY